MAGLVLFAVASLAGGLAQSDAWLIAARAVQGLGAAIVSPAALSIVTTTSPRAPSATGRSASGAPSPAPAAPPACCSAACSPQWAGWEWVLFVNVPIGLAAARARAAPAAREPRTTARASFDVPGAVTVTAGLVAARLRARRRQQRRLGLDADARRSARSSLALLAAFVADRAPHKRTRCAVLDLPPAHAARRERRRPADRHVAVLDVLLHLALPAAGAGLRRAEGRPLLPAAGGRDHRLGGRRLAAGHAPRLQAGADRRAAAHRGRPAVVLAGLAPAAPTSATCWARRCSPRSGSASRSCR